MAPRPLPRRRGGARETARHVDARARARRGRADRGRAGAVHDALRLRRRARCRSRSRARRAGRSCTPCAPSARSREAICAARPGAVLGVRGPFGNAWPVDEAVGGDLVIVAGGIGLAPLRGASTHALGGAAATSARSSLLYGSRTPEDLLFARRARALARAARIESTSPSTRPTAAGGARSASSRSSSRGARFDPDAATALRLRARDHDALHRARRSLERGHRRRSGSTSRWSGTCAAASASAATASSARR